MGAASTRNTGPTSRTSKSALYSCYSTTRAETQQPPRKNFSVPGARVGPGSSCVAHQCLVVVRCEAAGLDPGADLQVLGLAGVAHQRLVVVVVRVAGLDLRLPLYGFTSLFRSVHFAG